jgi:alpha-amylase
MQRDAFASLNKLHGLIMENGNDELINTYRHLQTSDHFYYMSTKRDNDGKVHQYFSPYASPYEAFMNYMNVAQTLRYGSKRKLMGAFPVLKPSQGKSGFPWMVNGNR